MKNVPWLKCCLILLHLKGTELITHKHFLREQDGPWVAHRCSCTLYDSLPCHMLSADKYKRTITLKGRNAIFCSPDDSVGKTSMRKQSTGEQKSRIKAHMLRVY